jgi:hypothetical protein
LTITVANDSNIAEESAATVDNIRQPGLFSSVVQLIESLMSEEHLLVSFNLLYLKAGNSGHARCSTSGNRIYRVMWTSSTVKNEHELLLAVRLRRSLPTRMIWFCDTIRRNELPLLSQADSHEHLVMPVLRFLIWSIEMK